MRAVRFTGPACASMPWGLYSAMLAAAASSSSMGANALLAVIASCARDHSQVLLGAQQSGGLIQKPVPPELMCGASTLR
jgi:hypothetical protein